MHSSDNGIAKLFIAKPSVDMRAFAWRFKLLDREKIYPAEKLLKSMKAYEKKDLASVKLKRLTDYARSEAIVLDEFELTTLIVTQWLLKADTLTEKQLLIIDRKSRTLLKSNTIANREDYFQRTRKNLTNHGKDLLRVEVRKIRAKIAFQELVALLDPDEMIPVLCSLSPVYLACPFVQTWIRAQQFQIRSRDINRRREAMQKLNRVWKAVSGDPRKFKPRKFGYWALGFRYMNLTEHIKGFRVQKSQKKFDTEFFQIFCKDFKVPKIYTVALLDKKRAAGQLALEIMAATGDIADPRAFLKFQPTIRKLQKKHFGGDVLSVAREISPIIFDFLDLPSKLPEFFIGQNALSVVERISISF